MGGDNSLESYLYNNFFDRKERIMPCGAFFWYTGTSIPSTWRVLLCDGAVYPTTGVYAELYAVIGHTYDDIKEHPDDEEEVTFQVPNLLDCDRFIRAGDTSSVGTTEIDEIRSIKGSIDSAITYEKGTQTGSTYIDTTQSGNGYYTGTRSWQRLIFDANHGESSENDMAGHANGTDIHPYNIRFLPLIAY